MALSTDYGKLIQKENLNELFLIGFFKADGGDSCYVEINGGCIVSASHDYFSHTSGLIDIDVCENDKYIGESFIFDNKVVHVAVPKWVIDFIDNGKVKNWKHGKNLFLKNLKSKTETLRV